MAMPLSAAFIDNVISQTLCCLGDNINIHTVGSGPITPLKPAVPNLGICIETFLYLNSRHP